MANPETGFDSEAFTTMLVWAFIAAVIGAMGVGVGALLESVTGKPNFIWTEVVQTGYGSRVWRSTVSLPPSWPTGAFVSCATMNDPWFIMDDPNSGKPLHLDPNLPVRLNCYLERDPTMHISILPTPADVGLQLAEMDVKYYGLVDDQSIKRGNIVRWECKKTSSDARPIECRKR